MQNNAIDVYKISNVPHLRFLNHYRVTNKQNNNKQKQNKQDNNKHLDSHKLKIHIDNPYEITIKSRILPSRRRVHESPYSTKHALKIWIMILSVTSHPFRNREAVAQWYIRPPGLPHQRAAGDFLIKRFATPK